MAKKKAAEQPKEWAIVELMGHVRVGGILTEVERFGAKMGRIDIPIGPKKFVTQFFGGSSVYRITPCTEEAARVAAAAGAPAPIEPWEIPKPPKVLTPGRNATIHQVDHDEEPF